MWRKTTAMRQIFGYFSLKSHFRVVINRAPAGWDVQLRRYRKKGTTPYKEPRFKVRPYKQQKKQRGKFTFSALLNSSSLASNALVAIERNGDV